MTYEEFRQDGAVVRTTYFRAGDNLSSNIPRHVIQRAGDIVRVRLGDVEDRSVAGPVQLACAALRTSKSALEVSLKDAALRKTLRR